MTDNLIKIDANSNICDSRVVINKNFAVLSKRLASIDNKINAIYNKDVLREEIRTIVNEILSEYIEQEKGDSD